MAVLLGLTLKTFTLGSKKIRINNLKQKALLAVGRGEIMSNQIEEFNITLAFVKKHGLKLIPMHSTNPTTGECHCKNIACRAVGKHPIYKGWQNGPFLEKTVDFVTSYQGQNYYTNCGIATTSNHTVLDIDSEESYQWFCHNYPLLIQTPTVKTAKGYHLHFKSNGKITNKVRFSKEAIDIRTEGGIAMGGGSVHQTGHIYKWINPDNNLEEFPYEILKTEETKKEPLNNEVRTRILDGERNSSLFKLACDSLKKGIPTSIAFELIHAVNNSSCVPPLSDEEVEQLFTSAHTTITSSTKEPKFDVSKLHGPIADLVRKIDPYTEANAIAVYMQMISILGGYFGRIAGAHVSGDRHYPNIFMLIVGNSSVARKGTSLGVATAILKQVIPDFVKSNMKSGASSGEGIPYHLRDPLYEMKNKKKDGKITIEKVLVDQGVSDKRLVIVETEFGSVLISMKREGNKLSTVFRDAYDSKNLGTLTKNNSVTATNPHVSIIAHITIEEFRHLLDVVDYFNGFGNRFMYFYTKSEKCLPHAPAVEDIDLSNELKGLKAAIDFWTPLLASPHEIRIKFTKEAANLWETIYPEIKDPKVDGIVGTFLSRGPAHVKKLAIILAMVDMKTEIHPIHLASALELWNYSSETVKFIFKDKNQTVTKKALKAIHYLESSLNEQASRTEISSKCFQRNASAESIDEIKNELKDKGIIKVNESPNMELWELS